VLMRSLLEPAGFFFEAPVPLFPSLHLLVPSSLGSQRFMLPIAHISVGVPYPLLCGTKTCG
jgi:hypothetical protein